MLEESRVDLKNRVLQISGIVDAEIFASLKIGLPDECRAEECFFASYSYADLRVPKYFEVIFDLSNPEKADLTSVSILAVTQQFSIAWDHVPHGWKTICWLGPSAKLSKTLKSLHRAKSWQLPTIGLASLESWAAFKLARREL